MLFTEWDRKEAMKIEREEALEDGITQGRAEGVIGVAKNFLRWVLI